MSHASARARLRNPNYCSPCTTTHHNLVFLAGKPCSNIRKHFGIKGVRGHAALGPLWQMEGRVGLDPPVRGAIAVSRNSRLRGNGTLPVILSEAEESLQ